MALPVDVVVDDPTDEVNIQCEDEAAVSLRFRMFLPPGQLNMIYDWQVLIGKRRQESSFETRRKNDTTKKQTTQSLQ